MPAPKDPIKYEQYKKVMEERVWSKRRGHKITWPARRHTEEDKKRMSERFSGKGNPMYGKKHTLEALKKIRAIPRPKGDKANAWRGGTDRWWKQKVAISQNFTCQRCGMFDDVIGFMEVDHIKPKSHFPALKHEISNGQVLCPNCHRRKTMEDRAMGIYYKTQSQ
jgi:5-methylcytosine-specific restriction endonuclease McrA